MDQFVTAERKFPLTLSLPKTNIFGIELVCGFATVDTDVVSSSQHEPKTELVFTNIHLNLFYRSTHQHSIAIYLYIEI